MPVTMTDDQCPRCAGDHDGYEAGTLGAELRCLHAQAARIGAFHMRAQISDLITRVELGMVHDATDGPL